MAHRNIIEDKRRSSSSTNAVEFARGRIGRAGQNWAFQLHPRDTTRKTGGKIPGQKEMDLSCKTAEAVVVPSRA